MLPRALKQGDGTLPWLRALLAERLGMAPAALDPDERLHRYGLTSLTAASVVALLSERLGRPLSATLLWDHPTLTRLAAFLDGRPDAGGRQPIAPLAPDEPIAIVGMACRLPGAASLEAFWTLLKEGVDAITIVPPDRWPIDALCDPDPHAPGRMATPWGGFIDGVDQFDAGFFGLSPREAAQADPQQRLALELAWEALEDAGIRARTLSGSRTGVFIGAMWSDYARLLTNREGIAQHTATGQDISIISARIAYTLGLEGPALTIDTACSSALVAVHQACRSLRAGESRLALAGGVHLLLAPESSIAMTKFGAMAPDGRCKPFDARANGYVRGEGGGLVVLKPLRAAQADGDRVYAVIRGSAVNNDGPSNGLTAPNPGAQRGMLQDALDIAGVDPLAVDYVEAHGTGTAVGDPIEAQALAAVLCAGRPATGKLRIGSVKSNIGHLEAAAGAAGLIKLALSLHHRWIPASLHYQSPNPAIDFAANALVVQHTGSPWPDPGEPAHVRPIGGVSSFGFGGTNCHVLLQAAGLQPSPGQPSPGGRPVFVFAGNGGNWAGMARGLLTEPAFAAELEACDGVLATLGYPAPVLSVLDDARVTDVATGQPALCAFQLALAALLRSRGVTPAAVVGHSVGEAAAACVAGALTRTDALRIVVVRSNLQQSVAGQGGMALAAAPAGAVMPLLPHGVVVAGENGPRATLLAGARGAIAETCVRLDAAGIVSQPIDVPVAYHSPQMDPLRPQLEQALADIRPVVSAIPIISTVMGAPIDGAALTASYWGRNLREPVRFRQAMEALVAEGHTAFLELAPHPLLAAQMRQMAPDASVVSPLRRGLADAAALESVSGERKGQRPRHLLLLSARSAAALDALVLSWAARLPENFPDLCHTALVGRERFAWRLALHAADGVEAQDRLRTGNFQRGEAKPETAAFDQQRGTDEAWDVWLDRCAAAFVAGADIDGTAFEANEPWRVTSAPTYPFERERHWLPVADSGLSYRIEWERFEPQAGARQSWPDISAIHEPPDPGLDAEATAFARAALAAVPLSDILPRYRDLAARMATWDPMPTCGAREGPVASLLRRAGAALPEVLAGRLDALEVLFPGGDLDAAAAIYQAPPFAAAQNALALTLQALGRPLRVLELGAGTGALTDQLLQHLPPGSVLTCSDVSDAFLAALRRRFAGHPALRTARFDLDQPTPPPGAPFDAIVAANVVHAGARIVPILRQLRAMLAPGGVLGLVELTAAPRWVDLVFGLTEGWWRFRGDPDRPDHALMDPAIWRKVLADAEFTDIELRSDGDAHAVVLARAPATIARWQVIGDGAAAACVADEPEPAYRLYAPGEADPAALVTEVTALAGSAPMLTIVHGATLAHAALAGAARALALEHPDTVTASIELADASEPTLETLRAVLGRTGPEDQLRIVGSDVFVPRLARVTPIPLSPSFSPDALYVLAGGFGRLGRMFARYLIDRGARHLLLVGRSSGDPAEIAAAGANVRALSLDLTRPTAAATLRAAFDRRLGGIVHAAGIADGPADAVLASKLGITATLAAAAGGLAPDFLLLFSSAAGAWGARGRVAYAAANRALDRWAEQARAGGLPATAIAFGRFEEPGLLSSVEAAVLDDAGLRAMPVDAAFTAAFGAVADGVATRVVAAVDWPRFRAGFEARRRRPLFDRFALPAAFGPPAPPGAVAFSPGPLPKGGIGSAIGPHHIARLVAEVLGHDDASRIDPQLGLFEQGLDSLMAVALRRRLEEAAGVPIPAATLFAHPTVSRLAGFLAGIAPAMPARVQMAEGNEPIAIVGLGCRFAGGADGPEAFLATLMAGRDVIGAVPSSRPTAAAWGAAPVGVRQAAFLDDIEQFDAAFFGISPREAAQLDPQQRLLLELTWQALEQAGIAPDRLNGTRTGVFIGATGSDYAALARDAGLDAHSLVGQPSNTLAGRLAYQFGLHGPALTLDTACSSSLVALHLAVRALRTGEADLALAGGVNLLLTPDTSQMLAQAGLLAPDGRCKVFDAAADGYVRGEGCGIVVLKPMSRAKADGDRVLAVIRGSAVNHDGRSSSFTAPNGAAQAAVIRDALADAGLTPDAIDLVEAHGTGTALGDPIELDALADVFGERDRPLLVGSVKAAIGHAEAAAGIAGVIKTILCLRASALPPQPHFERLNPHARQGSPVTVAMAGKLAPTIRHAGVSAFGASGTNGHVILESMRAPTPERGEGPAVLLLSARTETALDQMRRDAMAALADGLDFADFCHTAWVGRARLGCWLLADSAAALVTAPIRTGPAPDLPVPQGRRVTIPATPFERQRHWLPTASPTLDRRIALGPPHRSARSGETVWETRLDPEAPWLRDHVVEGEIILPAAGFLHLALVAGISALAEVAYRRRLVVPPNGVAVQLVHDRSGDLTLYAEEAQGWVEIATARVEPATCLAKNTPPGPAAAHSIEQAELAAGFARRGFAFGPEYRLIRELRHWGTGADGMLAETLPLDPPVIDAALQALSALLPSTDRPWLPARVARVLSGQATNAGIVRARLGFIDERRAVGDAWLEHADGTVALRLEGVELRAAPAEPGAWYHDVIWRPALTACAPPQGHWKVIEPCPDPGEPAVVDVAGMPLADGIIDLRTLTAEPPAACIEQIVALVRAAAAQPGPPQLLFVSRGASAAPPVLPSLMLAGPTLAGLAGSTSAEPMLPDRVPAASVLMGLQPVIDAEYPALRCRWVDLDPDETDIPADLHGPAGRYALRQGRLLTPEIVKAAPAPSGPVELVVGPERSLADLRLVPQPDRQPASGEVLIAVEAVGLNFKDVLTALGRTQGADERLGLECAGIVLATGPGVAGLIAGDPVVGFGPGVLGSRAVLPATRVIRRPDWLDADTAATLPVACLTAWHGLHDHACLRPGMRVLIHAGAGGVGGMAVRLARLAGARVFATASAGKHAAALEAGAEAVGDSRSLAFVEPARRWAEPDGFDVVLNALGPDIAEASARLLRPDGLFLEIGNAPAPAGRNRRITFDLDQPIAHDPGWFADRMTRILDLIRTGSLAPPRRTVLPLSQAGEALQALGQGRTTGKLVLRLPTPVGIRSDGTYLVTGGTGAVGRAMAGWLTGAGAGRVIVAARRPEPVPGCETVRVDVADGDALAALIATLPDLRGVVHAAGVVHDATIDRLAASDVAKVLAPKVAAAAHLDALTRSRSLDFFLLVSSTAGSLKSPGQAAYAGANAWIDRLAAARRAAGYPAVSIGSGPWAGGMFARLDAAARARLERDGYRPMMPHRAAAAFVQVLADGAVHRLVMDRVPTDAAVGDQAPAQPAAEAWGAGLLALAPAERAGVLQRELAARVIAVLGFSSGTRLDPHRALRDLGLDSLLSVSLRNELAAAFGLDLPATLLFDHPTLATLAGHILAALDGPELPLAELDEAALAALLESEL